MSFKNVVEQIVKESIYFSGSPTGFTQAEMLNWISSHNFGGIGECFKTVADETYMGPYTNGFYTMPFIMNGKHYDATFSGVGGLYANLKIKICLNYVRNCSNQLPSSITVLNYHNSGTDNAMTKEDFISEFGDFLMLDIKNFPSNLSTATIKPLSLEDQPNFASGIAQNWNPANLGIVWGDWYSQEESTGSIPLIQGYSSFYNELTWSDAGQLNGKPTLDSFSGQSACDLYEGYLNVAKQRSNNFDAWKKYGSEEIPRCLMSNRQNVFLFDKEILDELVLDLLDMGINISYVEEGLTPVLASPRLTSLTVDNASITPEFDSDFAGPYTIETTRNSLSFHWTANSDTEKVLFDLVEQTENSKTIYFSETNEVALTAVHDSNNYFDYEIAIILNNPEQGDDDTGGTGDNTSDQITNETNASGLASTITNTYLMNLKEVMECQSKLWDTDFIQMLSQLATPSQSAIINLMLFPFDLNDYDEHDALISSDVSSITLGNFAYNIAASGAAAKILSPLNKNIELHFKLNTPILPFFGTFLDSEPYTKCMLYLPYIGYQEIDADFVYNRKLDITYIIDISSGQAKVQIWTQKGNETKFLLNEFSSQIGLQISLSSSNWNQMKLGMAIKGLEIGATGIATQGASLMSGLSDLVGTGITQMTQRQITAGQNQDTTDRSSPQDCFILFIRQQPQVPDNYDSRFGRPSLKKAKISDCHGFTTIVNPIIETSATSTEKEELISILSSGFIVK